MAELLGAAVLEIGANIAELAAKLDDAKARVAAATAEMQAMLDSLHANLDTTGLGGALYKGAPPASTLGSDARLRELASSLREHSQITRDLIAAQEGRPEDDKGGETTIVESHSGIFGVRGPSAPGSIGNPIVVVLEAGVRTPLGGLGAAVGYDSASSGDQRTVVATTQGDETRVTAAGGSDVDAEKNSATDAYAVDLLRRRRNDLAEELKSAQWSYNGTVNRNTSGSPAAEARIAAAEDRLNKARDAWAAAKTEHESAAAAAELAAATAERSPAQAAAREMGNLDLARAIEALEAEKAASGDRRSGGASAVLAGEAAGDTAEAPGIAPVDRAVLTYALRAGNRVQQAAILRKLQGEGHGDVAAQILLAAGGGGDRRIPPLISDAAAGGEDVGGGGPKWPALRDVAYGRGFLPATAGALTIGSFAGFGPEHLLLTGGSVIGSGLSALGGGALLGAGAAGKFGVGFGSDVAVGASTVADTKTLYASYEKLREAVANYGKNSKQAKEAQEELDQTMKSTLSGTAGVTAELHLAEKLSALNVAWDKGTSAARVEIAHLGEQAVSVADVYLPLVAHAAQQNFAVIGTTIKPLFSWLKGPEALGIFEQLETEFKDEIPTTIHAISQAFEFFGKTIAYTAPLTGKLLSDIDAFFTRLNTPTGFARWEAEMTKLIGNFHVWGAFLHELGGALVDLFDKDAHTGEALIETLTEMLHHVREYEKSVAGGEALRNIFTVHKEEIIALLHAIAPLSDSLSHIYLVVAPPLVQAVTAIAEAFASVLKTIEKAGPLADWALGLLIIAQRLKLLSPLLAALKADLIGNAKATESVALADATLGQQADVLAARLGVAARGTAAATGVDLAIMRGTATELAAGGGLHLKEKSILSATEIGNARVNLGATAAESAAPVEEAGLLGSLGAVLTKSNLLRGGLLGFLGLMGGSALSGAVGAHGTLGSSISAAGAGAGVGGAVLGSEAGLAYGPFGAALGGAIGFAAPYIIKGIEDLFASGHSTLEKETAALAHGYVEHLGTLITPERQTKRQGELTKALREARRTSSPEAAAGRGEYREQNTTKLEAEEAKRYGHVGVIAGEAFHEAFEHVHAQTTFGFIFSADRALASLPEKARGAAASTMIAYAAELEHQGRLPAGAAQRVIDLIEHRFPALTTYLQSQGRASAQALTDALNLKTAESNVSTQLKHIEQYWGLMNVSVGSAEQALTYIIAHSSGEQRKIAEAEYKGLAQGQEAVFDAMTLKARNAAHEQLESIKRLAVAMPAAGAPGFAKYGAMVTQWAEHLAERVAEGVETLEQGVAKINSLLSAELTNVGLPGNTFQVPLPGKGPGPVTTTGNTFSTPVAAAPKHGAEGGAWQVGSPGEPGMDTVPLSMMVAPGEQVVVFNRHQVPEANERFADVGGLAGFFKQGWAPNYMASGGIATPHVGGRGAIAAIDRAGLSKVAGAANSQLGSYAGVHGHGGDAGANERLGREMMIAAGWPASEWPFLQQLWTRESGWSSTAVNKSSGAAGIAQSLGHGPVTLGDARGQIEWGLNYIRGRYGSPRLAWAHETAAGWYSGGGGHGLRPVPIKEAAQPITGGLGHFGAGAHTNPKPPLPPQYHGHFKIGESLTLPWITPKNVVLHALGLDLEEKVPGAAEAYQGLSNEYSLSEYSTFISTEGPHGETVAPYIDQVAVSGRLEQLEHLLKAERAYQHALHGALSLATGLQGWVTHEILAAEARIKKLQEQIAAKRAEVEANVKRLKALKAHPKQNAKAIKALEKQNIELGGAAEYIGSGGALAKLTNARETQKEHLAALGDLSTSLREDVKGIQGGTGEFNAAAGSGGSLGEARITVLSLEKQERELGQGPHGALTELLEREQAHQGSTNQETEKAELYREQGLRTAQELAVSQAQYKVLASFPPFGGSFELGGVVPGMYPGEARTVVAHAGETITPEGMVPEVHVKFADGMGWLSQFVTTEVKQVTRGMGRGASRPLPSRGGGWL